MSAIAYLGPLNHFCGWIVNRVSFSSNGNVGCVYSVRRVVGSAYTSHSPPLITPPKVISDVVWVVFGASLATSLQLVSWPVHTAAVQRLVEQ